MKAAQRMKWRQEGKWLIAQSIVGSFESGSARLLIVLGADIALVASGAVPLPAAIAAVLGANIGTTGTIWLAGLLVSDGMPKGDTLRIAMAHTGVNLFMAATLLPFVHRIAQFLGRF